MAIPSKVGRRTVKASLDARGAGSMERPFFSPPSPLRRKGRRKGTVTIPRSLVTTVRRRERAWFPWAA
jgi:hypothetical protein